jgi:DNA-binding transcriptional LysR family regulator
MSAQKHWQARIGRRLRLRDLHVLLAVAHSRSMAKAARELSISQPAVSQAIAELERTLDVRLLDRGPRGVEPTEYGRALLKRSLTVFDELGEAIKDIKLLADPTRGELRLGCPESIVTTFLPAVVDGFSRQYPHVVLKIEQVHDVSPHFRELRDRKVDFVLARITPSFAASDLAVESLLEDRFSVAAGTTSAWARRRKLALAELVDEPWVLPSPDTLAGIMTKQAFQANGLGVPRATVYTLSTHLRCSLIESGRFVGMVPTSVLRFNAARFSLKTLPVECRVELGPVAIVTLRDRTPSPLLHKFIAAARAAIEPWPARLEG